MKKLILYFLFLFIGINQSIYAQITTKSIYFDTKSIELTQENKILLNKLVDSLKNKNINIKINGHTDNQGTAEENLILSQKRAEKIKNYLIENKIDEKKINIYFFGQEKPIANNQDEEGRIKNRRVEIEIITKFEEIIEIKRKDKIQDLYQITKSVPQIFIIQNDKDVVLTTQTGMVIYIKANTFDKILTNIHIYIYENLIKSEMILNNLSTQSNQQLLETRGMFEIQAKANPNDDTFLIPQKTLVYFLPTTRPVSEIKLFNGKRKNEQLDWIENENKITNIPLLTNLSCTQCGGMREVNCSFFFCKIKNFLKRTFNARNEIIVQNTFNTTLTVAQITNDLLFSNIKNIPPCADIQKLLQEFQVNNKEDLFYALNQPLMQAYNVKTEKELLEALKNKKLNEIEAKYKQENIKAEELSYYAFQNQNLGLINCDIFYNFDKKEKVKVIANIKIDENVDCKLVFKKLNAIMQPNAQVKKNYAFEGVPKNQDAWLIGLSIKNKEAYLAIEAINTKEQKFYLNFKKVSLEELKETLKKIDK